LENTDLVALMRDTEQFMTRIVSVRARVGGQFGSALASLETELKKAKELFDKEWMRRRDLGQTLFWPEG
jgi:hypothetical protein